MNELLLIRLAKTGRCRIDGLTVLELADLVEQLDLDPRAVRVIAGELVVTEDRLMGGRPVTLR